MLIFNTTKKNEQMLNDYDVYSKKRLTNKNNNSRTRGNNSQKEMRKRKRHKHKRKVYVTVDIGCLPLHHHAS